MSEIQAPLNPDVQAETAQVEPTAESAEAQTQAEAFDQEAFRKSMRQEFQQERANTVKQIERLLGEHLGNRAAPEKKSSKLDEVMAKLNGAEGQAIASQSPEIAAILKDYVESSSTQDSKLEELRRDLAARNAFEDYMEDKPAGFREAYTKQQRLLSTKYRERGIPLTNEQLSVALMEWADNWLEKGKTAQPLAPTAPGVKRIVPAQGGARQKADSTPRRNPFGLKV